MCEGEIDTQQLRKLHSLLYQVHKLGQILQLKIETHRDEKHNVLQAGLHILLNEEFFMPTKFGFVQKISNSYQMEQFLIECRRPKLL